MTIDCIEFDLQIVEAYETSVRNLIFKQYFKKKPNMKEEADDRMNRIGYIINCITNRRIWSCIIDIRC